MPYYPPASSGAAITVKESDGSPSVNPVTEIKVSNGTLTDNTGGSVTIATGASGSGTLTTVKDEGSNLDTAVTSIDFVGAGVTATNSTHAVTVTIPGGGSGGALVFLEAHTASGSATLDFTTFISSTYDDYLIEGVDLDPASNAVSLLMRVGTGGGPTYDSGSNYYGVVTGVGANGASIGTTYNPSTGFNLATPVPSGTAYGHVNFAIRLSNPQSSNNKNIFGTCVWHNGTSIGPGNIGGLWATSTVLTAVQFLFSTGNIATGTIRVYGISKS